jgi:F-type H+-transporting ATPase subunit gamma
MSVELQQVKQRIRSTRQIRQVTGAMQRVASARLATDRRHMEQSRRYARSLAGLMTALAREAPYVDHPFLQPGRGNRVLLLVCGADRGLCGGYNTTLAEAVENFAARTRPRETDLVVMGRIAARRARRAGLAVREAVDQPARLHRKETIHKLAARARTAFLEGEAAEVHVLYSRFITGLRQVPVSELLLPAAQVEPAQADTMALSAAAFEPSAEAILGRLLAEYLEQMLDHAYLNSVASENASRQSSMSRATENAAEILSELNMTFSRLRQESITSEILEVVGGGTA